MHKEDNKFQTIICNLTKNGMYMISVLIGLIGILSIFITANLNTEYNFAGETTIFSFSFGIIEILLSLAFLLVLAILSKVIFKRIPAKYLMIPISIVCLVIYIYWVNAIQLSPEADQKNINDIAKTFVNSGDIYHYLQPTQYIHHFPYQCGIAYIFSLFQEYFQS